MNHLTLRLAAFAAYLIVVCIYIWRSAPNPPWVLALTAIASFLQGYTIT